MWVGIAILLLYVGGNAYLFVRLWQALQPAPMWCKVLFATLFAIAALALFVAMALRHAPLPEIVQRTLFGLGAIWLVFLLYMVLATLLFDVAHLIFPTFKYGVWYALAATTLLLTYGYINYRHPRVEHVTITTDKHMEADRYRIILVSDIHLGYGTSKRALARYIEMINAQHGDVVVIAGDLIDNSIVPVEREDMCSLFRGVHAPDGVYMVAGNHEYISGIDACAKHLDKQSITLLRDSIVQLRSGIQLIGRDDRSNSERATLTELMQDADMSHLTVVVDHQPYDVEQCSAAGVDIYLAGHTHHGQVWPLSLLTDALYAQSHGYGVWGNSHVIVSSGLSLWGPPFRIGTHSDMYVIEVCEKK